MFDVHMPYLGNAFKGRYDTFEQAKARVKELGFCCNVMHNGKIVAHYDTIGGWAIYENFQLYTREPA